MKFLKVSDITAGQDTSLPLRNGETYGDRDLIDGILKQHWNGKEAWMRVGEKEQEEKHFTYGEVTPMGVRQLIFLLELEGLNDDQQGDIKNNSENENLKPPSIFYDLGSGAGKLVAQMFLENVVTVAVGIELSKHRHTLSERNWESLRSRSCSSESKQQQDEFLRKRLQDDQYMGRPRVEFWHQDILDSDFAGATHLYVSSLCFPEEVTEQVSQIIVNNQRQYGKLKVVVSLSNLPALENDENRPKWKKHLDLIQMTWGFSTARVYRFVE